MNGDRFVARTARWIIWSRSAWGDNGWIALDFLDLKTSPGKRRHTYSGIGFDGSKLAKSSELARMERNAPGEPAALATFLRNRTAHEFEA